MSNLIPQKDLKADCAFVLAKIFFAGRNKRGKNAGRHVDNALKWVDYGKYRCENYPATTPLPSSLPSSVAVWLCLDFVCVITLLVSLTKKRLQCYDMRS